MATDKYSLMIGRFQPLHDGHIALVRSLIVEGKKVCIAIRDTPLNGENPYTMSERKVAIAAKFTREIHEGLIVFVAIPDISEVVYGRDVGWAIRQIHLDAETESISASEIRETGK